MKGCERNFTVFGECKLYAWCLLLANQGGGEDLNEAEERLKGLTKLQLDELGSLVSRPEHKGTCVISGWIAEAVEREYDRRGSLLKDE